MLPRRGDSLIRTEVTRVVQQHGLLFAKAQGRITNNRHDRLLLLGQTEHVLGNDVGLHLARASTDGGGEAIEIGALPESTLAGAIIPHIERPIGTLGIDGELTHAP